MQKLRGHRKFRPLRNKIRLKLLRREFLKKLVDDYVLTRPKELHEIYYAALAAWEDFEERGNNEFIARPDNYKQAARFKKRRVNRGKVIITL